MVSTSFLKQILKEKNITQLQLKERLGISQGNVSSKLSGETIDSIKFIKAVSDLSGIPISDIVNETVKSGDSILYNIQKSDIQHANEPHDNAYYSRDNSIIPITSYRGAANAMMGYQNMVQEHHTDALTMPSHLLKPGVHMCIGVKGMSMAPTLMDGGYIVCRLVEKSEWKYIPDERVYVVVEKESGGVKIKRIKNRITQHGFLVLTSDNLDKNEYPNYNLFPEDIEQLWDVEWYLSAKLPNPHVGLEDRFSIMEESITENKLLIDRLFEEIKILKNR